MPLNEKEWIDRTTGQPVTRALFMKVLATLERVMVKATSSGFLYSTAIADVSMDTAHKYYSGVPAHGVEVILNCNKDI